jgi:hypothetical protein
MRGVYNGIEHIWADHSGSVFWHYIFTAVKLDWFPFDFRWDSIPPRGAKKVG